MIVLKDVVNRLKVIVWVRLWFLNLSHGDSVPRSDFIFDLELTAHNIVHLAPFQAQAQILFLCPVARFQLLELLIKASVDNVREILAPSLMLKLLSLVQHIDELVKVCLRLFFFLAL